jgi:site-specific recombinase XerD
MANELIAIDDNQGLEVQPLDSIGQLANQLAGRAAWSDYQERLAANTRNRQDNDLALFAAYLTEKGLQAGDFARDPEAWRGVTWGLVAGFMRWQLGEGYAVGTVNVRLATVKAYSRLAVQAGTMAAGEYAQIRTVKSYRRAEAKHIDEERTAAGIPTHAWCAG